MARARRIIDQTGVEVETAAEAGVEGESEDPHANGSAAGGAPSERLLRIAKLIYALHGLAILIGVLGTATVLGSFLFGLPSIAAVILNYIERDGVRGTWLESHFRWQIRTFWFALLWAAIGFMTLVLIVGFAILGATGLWVAYRVLRGSLALADRRPLPV